MKTGRPRNYRHRVIFSSSVESNLLEEFEQLASDMKLPRNELLQQAMKLMIKQKKAVGSDNPIKITYNTQNKVMSLLHYLQETIDADTISEECSKIDDHKTLAKLKGVAHTISKFADRQSMLLLSRGVKA